MQLLLLQLRRPLSPRRAEYKSAADYHRSVQTSPTVRSERSEPPSPNKKKKEKFFKEVTYRFILYHHCYNFFAFASVFLPFTNYSSLLFELFYTLLHLLCAASPVFKLSSDFLSTYFLNILFGKFPLLCHFQYFPSHFRFPFSAQRQ